MSPVSLREGLRPRAPPRPILTPPEPKTPSSLAFLKRKNKANLLIAFQEWWLATTPNSYKELGLKVSLPYPKELSLSRFTLGKLYSNRSGHGDFKAYHERFNHPDADPNCSCGRPKAPGHFYSCSLGVNASRLWHRMPLQDILALPLGAIRLEEWLKSTGYFKDLCPAFQKL
jgi:hypothetical protein